MSRTVSWKHTNNNHKQKQTKPSVGVTVSRKLYSRTTSGRKSTEYQVRLLAGRREEPRSVSRIDPVSRKNPCVGRVRESEGFCESEGSARRMDP